MDSSTANDLFLASDDWERAIPALQGLKTRLDVTGYPRICVLPLPGQFLDVCFDPVNLIRARRHQSNLFHRSAMAGLFAASLGRAERRVVELHELFFLGSVMSELRIRSILGTDLVNELFGAGVLRATQGAVRSEVLVAPFGGALYFSDPVRLQDHPDYCYLGRSTFTVPEFLRREDRTRSLVRNRAHRTRLLDLACGAGVGAIACAHGFDEVIGTDIVERCLRFARLNAAVNEVRHASFHYSDVFSAVTGDFDLIISNTPCVWADTEPEQPRTYASGGAEFGLELPAQMISGALDRLNPAGSLLAVLTAPIIRRKPYVVRAVERICDRRSVRVVLYPLLEEYELRSARTYRRHGISKMVRYLAIMEPHDRFSLSFGTFDTARLMSCRARTMPARALARFARQSY